MMQLQGLSKAYAGKPAIVDLSLTVHDDEYLTLLGPSGSGKSTLLRLVAGLERPDAGRIFLNGEDLTPRPAHKRGLGFVQQSYALFPHMSVYENVAFGLKNRQENAIVDESLLHRKVQEMLDLVGLAELGGRGVGQISGGQRQRVSLARTLVTEPSICLLDEPLGALDANLRERMTIELRRIRSTLGVTFLHVTGNEAEALAMGDRMIVLDAGRAIQIAPPDSVFNQPETVEVAKYINSYNILSGETRDGEFLHGAANLAMPAGVANAAAYVVRHDAVNVLPPGNQPSDGEAGLEARFIASEFMGSRVLYFFQGLEGEILQVENHLSTADPVTYQSGEVRTLAWNIAEVLAYDGDGRRIKQQLKGAA